MIDVGKVTVGTGHALPRGGFAQAVAHYDNSGTAAAVVRATDGKHGIWVSGQLVHDLPAAKIEELMRSPLSGDWRVLKQGGPLELCAALAVNVPGFPVRRPQSRVGFARDAAHSQLSLVASGVVMPPTDGKGNGKIMLPSGASVSRGDFEALVAAAVESVTRGSTRVPAAQPARAALALARRRMDEHRAMALSDARARSARLRLAALSS
jgi:hypothetical protein